MMAMNEMRLRCLTILMVIFCVNANNSSNPLNDTNTNTTANNTGSSRLFNNDKASVSVSVRCFSTDTLVTLINQQRIPIGKLQSGDQLLTVDGTTIVNTEMIMMLDQNQLSSAMFYTIITESGHKVSLTGLHLIPTVMSSGEIEYKSAKDIQQGDVLRVVSNSQVSSSSVTSVTMEVKIGYYAPLTMTGTLLVNDVAANCFTDNDKIIR